MLDEDSLKNIQHRKKVDGYIRDKQVRNTRIAHENLKQNLDNAYDMKAALRSVQNQGNKIERRMDGELFYNARMMSLMERVKESDFKEASRASAAEKKQQQIITEEAHRLNSIVTANKKANPEKWDFIPH